MIDAVKNVIFAQVTAATATTVYSHVPQDDGAGNPQPPAYPYVRLGELELNANDTETETGFNGFFTVDVFSQHRGSKEVADIQKEIYDALHRTTPAVVGWCISTIHQEFATIQTKSDGITRIGLQRFRIIFEPEPPAAAP